MNTQGVAAARQQLVSVPGLVARGGGHGGSATARGKMIVKTHRNSCLRVTPKILQEKSGERQQRRQRRRRQRLRQRQERRRRRRHTPGPRWQREVEGESRVGWPRGTLAPH